MAASIEPPLLLHIARNVRSQTHAPEPRHLSATYNQRRPGLAILIRPNKRLCRTVLKGLKRVAKNSSHTRNDVPKTIAEDC